MCFAYPNNRRRILCICTVFMPITAKPKLYTPRHPERTLLYQTVAEHYETWLELASAGQFDGQGDLADHVARMRADHAAAQDLAVAPASMAVS